MVTSVLKSFPVKQYIGKNANKILQQKHCVIIAIYYLKSEKQMLQYTQRC